MIKNKFKFEPVFIGKLEISTTLNSCENVLYLSENWKFFKLSIISKMYFLKLIF